MTESEVYLSDPIALRDREARLFICWRAVIDLLYHDEEACNPAQTRELIEFVFEEYDAARRDLLENRYGVRPLPDWVRHPPEDQNGAV